MRCLEGTDDNANISRGHLERKKLNLVRWNPMPQWYGYSSVEGDLRKFSDIGAWYAIEDCAQYDKKCSNPTSTISNETIANLNVQIVRDDMVRVQIPSPESTIQALPSFEEYTPPVTYPEEVEKTLGTLVEVEPLNATKLEEVGLNCNHNTLSSREVPSFDKPEPQPQPLPNCPPLYASLGTERGLKPPIKPQSPASFRMKVLDNLTIHTPPSSLVASFHLRNLYCYYRPCIDDPKKHYGFKPGLLGHSNRSITTLALHKIAITVHDIRT
ncbi:hypothetical protein Tco_0667462 [Tanacetum coccineum]